MKELCMVLITTRSWPILDLTTLVAIFPSRIVELLGHYILDEVVLGLELFFY
jgi:hypothetical protein